MKRSDYLFTICLGCYFLMLLVHRFHFRKGKKLDKRVEEDGRLIVAVVGSAVITFFIPMFLFNWKNLPAENKLIIGSMIAILLTFLLYSWNRWYLLHKKNRS